MTANKLKASGTFLVVISLLLILVSMVSLFWINHQMRRQAIAEAESKARILLDRNLATHMYFASILKPSIFKLTEGALSPEYFDPTWMSSTYAVREIDKLFKTLSYGKIIYKECAINARSPQNEADDFEREMLILISSAPEKIQWSGIRDIHNQPHYVLVRRSETMEKACLLCHGDPKDAPKDLIKYYGSERSFHREVRKLTSLASIRIPLSVAYAQANRSR